MQSVQALSSAVESQAKAAGGTLGLGTFLRTIIDTLKSLAVSQIDTEEERDALKDKAFALADMFVAPKFPVGWPFVRASLDAFLDNAMDRLPDLLKA